MTDGQSTLERWIPWIVLCSALYFFSLPLADNDLWGHLRFGLDLLESARLPETNGFAWTVPNHPWINHELLPELLFAAVWKLAGGPGLIAMKLAFGLATIAIIARTVRRRTGDPAARLLALVSACSLLSAGYLVRPQLFTFLLLAIWWEVLDRSTREGRSGALWILPLVSAVWVNAHGGVLAGLGVLGAMTAGRFLEDRRQGATMIAVGVVATAALLVNPYGIDLPIFLLEDVQIDRKITEWASVPLWSLSHLPLKAATILAFATLARRQGRPWGETLAVALATVAAFRHERHTPLFAIVTAPVLAAGFADAIAAIRGGLPGGSLSREMRRALAAGIAVICAFQVGSVARTLVLVRFQLHVPRSEFPVVAVDILKRTGLEGNLVVPFDWGEYAIWHLYPGMRVNVDGRYTTAYPMKTLDEAWAYREGTEGWNAHVEGADFAIAKPTDPTVGLLASSGEWTLLHRNDTAWVFARTEIDLPEKLPPSDLPTTHSSFP